MFARQNLSPNEQPSGGNVEPQSPSTTAQDFISKLNSNLYSATNALREDPSLVALNNVQ